MISLLTLIVVAGVVVGTIAFTALVVAVFPINKPRRRHGAMARSMKDFGFSILIGMGSNAMPTTEKRGASGSLKNAGPLDHRSPSGRGPAVLTCRNVRRGLEEMTDA